MRRVDDDIGVGGGVDRGDLAVAYAEGLVHDLDHRCKAVGRAGRRRHDPVPAGVVESVVDADDDVQGYSVSWWLDGTDESGANTQSVAGTWVDLGDKLEAGDVVHWTVTARDVWGDGLPSAVVSFSVVVAPMADADEGDGEEEGEPAAACASARGEGIAGIGAAFWAIRRRRRG